MSILSKTLMPVLFICLLSLTFCSKTKQSSEETKAEIKDKPDSVFIRPDTSAPATTVSDTAASEKQGTVKPAQKAEKVSGTTAPVKQETVKPAQKTETVSGTTAPVKQETVKPAQKVEKVEYASAMAAFQDLSNLIGQEKFGEVVKKSRAVIDQKNSFKDIGQYIEHIELLKITSLYRLEKYNEVIGEAEIFLKKYPSSENADGIRNLQTASTALKGSSK